MRHGRFRVGSTERTERRPEDRYGSREKVEDCRGEDLGTRGQKMTSVVYSARVTRMHDKWTRRKQGSVVLRLHRFWNHEKTIWRTRLTKFCEEHKSAPRGRRRQRWRLAKDRLHTPQGGLGLAGWRVGIHWRWGLLSSRPAMRVSGRYHSMWIPWIYTTI